MKRFGIVQTFGLALLVFAACSGLRIPQPLNVDSADWPTFAKSENRANSTEEAIIPPLTLEWEFDITGGIGNGSPLVIDSVLLIGNLRGELYALNAYTGKRIGWVDLGEAIQGAPVIDGNVAIVAVSSSELSLIGFDLVEGKPRWRKEYGDIEASPLLYRQRVYVGNAEGEFFCVDPATGERIWKFEVPENVKRKGIRSSAAANSGMVVFGADDGALYALDWDSGQLRWKSSTDAGVVGSPCIAGDVVCAANLGGTVYGIDLESGARRWQVDAGSPIYASVSYAANKVFVGTTGGTMYALDAVSGAVIWMQQLGSVINSGAVIANDILYVGTLKKNLFGLKIDDGTIVVKQDVPGRIKTSPAVARGRLYVATDERLILAFKGSAL